MHSRNLRSTTAGRAQFGALIPALLLLLAGPAVAADTAPGAAAAAAPAAAPAQTPPDPNAMTFTAWSGNEGRYFGEGTRAFIFADGDITADTPKQFSDFLAKNPPKVPNTIVVLNSDGGDLGAGLDFGALIRKAKLWTEVGSQYPVTIPSSPNIPAAMTPFIARPATPPFAGGCYSACTFAFLGGVVRSVPYASNFGVHRFEGTANDLSADAAQQMSGALVQYVREMGVAAQFVTEMSTASPSQINDLTLQKMAALKVITPHWHSSWQIATLNDSSGFYLQDMVSDGWGTHEIAVSCFPHPAQTPASGGQNQAAGTQSQGAGGKKSPVLQMTFFLDPGSRADLQTLVAAVRGYVLEFDGESIGVDPLIAYPAVIPSGTKWLAATVNIPADLLAALEQSAHIGFAFIFDANANLPIRLLQFVSDLDVGQLKSFRATCH